MSSYTTHERLIKEDAGIIDWDTAVNSNFDVQERGRHLYRYAGDVVNSVAAVTLDSSAYLITTDVDSAEEPFLGLSVSALNSNDQGQVLLFGTMNYPGGTWNVGPVYCEYAGGGALVQSGYLVSLLGSYSIPIAHAYSETGLFLARGMADYKLAWGMESWDYSFYLKGGAADGHATSNHQHVFPHHVGCFTVANTDTIFVANSHIKAGSVVCISPGGTVAALAMAGDHPLYISAVQAASGFWIKTANGSNFSADGNENYLYQFFD